MYNKLKEGPKIPIFIEDIIIPYEELVDKIRTAIILTERNRGYPIILGEKGKGKTTLIRLAVESLEKPKGIIYFNIPIFLDSEKDLAKAMANALGQNIDSDKGN
jgi:ABC-type cobalamin/Fe3+-siderophores transport system ATPase subunit